MTTPLPTNQESAKTTFVDVPPPRRAWAIVSVASLVLHAVSYPMLGVAAGLGFVLLVPFGLGLVSAYLVRGLRLHRWIWGALLTLAGAATFWLIYAFSGSAWPAPGYNEPWTWRGALDGILAFASMWLLPLVPPIWALGHLIGRGIWRASAYREPGA